MVERIYKWLRRTDDTDYCWRLREKLISPQPKGGLSRLYAMYQYKKALRQAGATIPLGTKFKGKPDFPHGFYGICISYGAKIGTGCTIFQQVTIGSNTLAGTKNPGAPVIGDNVYIGAGAKIIGGVRIGNNVRIGANCVVTHDIPDNCTVVLPPPRVIQRDAPMDNTFQNWGGYQPENNN